MEIASAADALRYLYGLSLNQTDLRFRGQAYYKWDVIPSIHRYSDFKRYQTVVHEKFLLDERPSKPSPPLTHTEFELEWLMVSQHYSVPTRLLDWSSDILIALYFACYDLKYMQEDGAVFVCNQNEYPVFKTYNKRAKENQTLSFVNTNVINPRMRLQSGSFMMWGHSPLDESTHDSYDLWKYHQSLKRKFFLEKIRIRSSQKKSILQELDEIYSINNDNIFIINGYLEKKYLDLFKILRNKIRLKTLYITDADRLFTDEEDLARTFFRIDCRNMFGQCINIREL